MLPQWTLKMGASQDVPQNWQEGRQPQHENHYSKTSFGAVKFAPEAPE